MENIKFWNPVEDSDAGSPISKTIGMEYKFAFQYWFVNFVWKTDEGEAESIVLLIFVLWWCLNRRWMGGGGVEQKVSFRASSNRIFFQREFLPKHKHDTFWNVVLTGYFYVLFLWIIVVSDFCPIDFTVNSHADSHFYKYIYLFQISYSVESIFVIIIHVTKILCIQIWFICVTPPTFFLIRIIFYRKKTLH